MKNTLLTIKKRIVKVGTMIRLKNAVMHSEDLCVSLGGLTALVP